jgi:hypothetical protein
MCYSNSYNSYISPFDFFYQSDPIGLLRKVICMTGLLQPPIVRRPRERYSTPSWCWSGCRWQSQRIPGQRYFYYISTSYNSYVGLFDFFHQSDQIGLTPKGKLHGWMAPAPIVRSPRETYSTPSWSVAGLLQCPTWDVWMHIGGSRAGSDTVKVTPSHSQCPLFCWK